MTKLGTLLLLLSVLGISSCSPSFVMRAAYEESKILLARQDINEAIGSEQTSEEEKKKLQLVLDAREFSTQMDLTPKDSFTLYTKVNKSPLAWVFMASMPDSFTVKTWWFPFIGTVPYKGYFDKEDAKKAALSAKEDGWETWVRGTDAFSTLGWFNDPVLSTTLSRDEFTIVNTVIHEIFHSTLWAKNHVDFNESAANFVGTYGMLDYYKAQYAECYTEGHYKCPEVPRREGKYTSRKTDSKPFRLCPQTGHSQWREVYPKGGIVCSQELENVKTARKHVERETDTAKTVEEMFEKLSELYESDIEKEEKLSKRQIIFSKLSQTLKEKYPEMKIFKQANNAELMQLKLYMTSFEDFHKVYLECSENWSCFINRIRQASEKAEETKESPFEHLLKD